MAQINPYLNFNGNTEEAFNFYKSVFGGDFMGGQIMRYKDMPGADEMPEADRDKVMHVGLEIGDGSYLMGTDTLESMGQNTTFGNNCQIIISPESREDADRLFAGLSAGGKIEAPMEDVFWGAYYGAFADKFGVNWMIHLDTNPKK